MSNWCFNFFLLFNVDVFIKKLHVKYVSKWKKRSVLPLDNNVEWSKSYISPWRSRWHDVTTLSFTLCNRVGDGGQLTQWGGDGGLSTQWQGEGGQSTYGGDCGR